MRLLIIRHGDPDYVHDSLTERGDREAEALAEYMMRYDLRDIYVSPLGRAQRTAGYTLRKLHRQAQTLDWLREFSYYIDKPQIGRGVPWDWMPADWTAQDVFYDKDRWSEQPRMEEKDIGGHYRYVCESFDRLLASYGYEREGGIYRVTKGNTDTIVFFCHFGLECVLLSHLMHVSPVLLWHGLCAAPTSVTTVYTEERQEGIAHFRATEFGSVTHLIERGIEPSAHARFREVYTDASERVSDSPEAKD